MKILFTLLALCFAINANAATYLLLSQTNAFAKGITNEAKAYTDAHAGGGNTIWTNSPNGTNLEGGIITGAYTLDSNTNGAIAYSTTLFPAFWGDYSTSFSAGYPKIDLMGLSESNVGLFLLGTSVGVNFVPTNSYSIFLLGTGAGRNLTITNCGDVYFFGFGAGNGSTIENAIDVYGFGSNAGELMNLTGSPQNIIGIGSGALSGLTGNNLRNILAIGSSAKATNSYDFVIGSTVYGTYFFPASKISFSGGGASQVFSVESDGSITTGGNTNLWSFGGVTNGAPNVSADGVWYAIQTNSAALNHYAGTDTNVLLAAIGGIPNTLAGVTNALELTGSTTTFLRSDGTQAAPSGGTTNMMVSTITWGATLSPTFAITGLSTVAAAPRRVTFRTTADANATTVNAPAGTLIDGDTMVWEILQDGTGGWTIGGWDAKYAFGTDITGITLSTGANLRDFITFTYNSTADKWFVVGYVRGY